MSKIIVGDPHAKASDLKEIEALLRLVEQEAEARKAEEIILLGDLWDTHRITHIDVNHFWVTRLTSLGLKFKVRVLVGNHDMIGDSDSEWRMSAADCLKGIQGITVIDRPMNLGRWHYIPYTHSEEKFKEAIQLLSIEPCDVLVAHQTFDGAKYDNGMFAPDGFNLESVAKYKQVVCGHIHTMMTFANIFYVGAPRWMTLSDANVGKYIWHWDGQFTAIPNTVTPAITCFEVKEGEELPVLKEGDKNYVTLVGNSKWIAEKSKDLKGKARIIPKPTDSLVAKKAKSYSSFKDFLQNQKLDVSLDDVVKCVEEA